MYSFVFFYSLFFQQFASPPINQSKEKRYDEHYYNYYKLAKYDSKPPMIN